MQGDSAAVPVGRVLPDRVLLALADQSASMLPQMIEQVAPFHGDDGCGVTLTREAALSSRCIGSSKSASGLLQVGSGEGSGSPMSRFVSAMSTSAACSIARASS